MMTDKPAFAALRTLQEGNARFVAGQATQGTVRAGAWRDFVAGQHPFAVVLGCSDSRVPVEMVFDQGLGDLFVIRVAGNVAAPSPMGSIEFAVAHLGVPLVVVLGHTHCGAVRMTLDVMQNKTQDDLSPAVRSIVDRVRPAVESTIPVGGHPSSAGVDEAICANVRASVRDIQHGLSDWGPTGATGHAMVVGALYELESGRVRFLDERGEKV